MKIVEFKNCANIVVEFQDEYKYRTPSTYQNFKRGVMKNPYDRTVYGVGYLGTGEYYCWEGNKPTVYYTVWENMLCRCYHEKDRHLHATYEDCTTCDNWHSLQNFGQWYKYNAYDPKDGGRLHIDKDILFKDNKIYSPETCIMVPQRINMLFMKKSRITDADLPAGIRRIKSGFSAEYNTKYLGVYETLDKAIEQYEIEKRIHIKELADEYKKVMPSEVYNALINW